MSAARQMFQLLADADDWALIGVKRGSSRAEIIHAAQLRLSAIAAHPQSKSPAALGAHREIREAARRLLAAAAEALRKKSDAGVRPPFGSIAAAVLMRRNPRRAHMFLAQLKANETSNVVRTSTALQKSKPAPEIILDEGIESVRRAPWWLAAFVALSVVGFVVEVFILRAQMQAATSRDNSKAADVEPANADKESAKESAKESGKESRKESGKIAKSESEQASSTAPVKSVDPAGSTAPALPGIAPAKSSATLANDSARLLRSRWQSVARAAVDIPTASLAIGTVTSVDRLDESVRQSILLERLAVLDLIARELEAGDDRSASQLLDTISTDSSIALPALVPILRALKEESDGELSKGLDRFPGSSQGRTALLRSFRTRPSAPGKLDARTLVQEALKGPNRGSRTIAQGILVDRGIDSLDVLDAVEERFGELASDPALTGLIRALSGVDPNGLEGAPAARAAIVKKMIVLRGSRIEQLDIASQDYVTTLRKIAAQMRIPTPPKESAELLRAINPIHSTRQLRMGGRSDEGVLHALVQNGTSLLCDQASDLKVRRPADQAIIDQVLTDAVAQRRQASSALGQAIANAHGMLALDAILLGVAGLRTQTGSPIDSPISNDWNMRFPSALCARWQSRLEALSPSNPAGYLTLAEEVADESNDDSSRLLVRQLYSLAAGLDPRGMATSAALGLAALEDDKTPEGRAAAHRWYSVAQQWSENPLSHLSNALERTDDVTAVGSAVRLGAVEALVQYRRGFGRRANDRLKKPQVRAFFESLMQTVPGGIDEFDRLSVIHVNGTPTPLSLETMDALLRLEHSLLRPQSQLWSDALGRGEGGPTFDAPIGTANEIFAVDPSINRWKIDGWVKGEVNAPVQPR